MRAVGFFYRGSGRRRADRAYRHDPEAVPAACDERAEGNRERHVHELRRRQGGRDNCSF